MVLTGACNIPQEARLECHLEYGRLLHIVDCILGFYLKLTLKGKGFKNGNSLANKRIIILDPLMYVIYPWHQPFYLTNPENKSPIIRMHPSD